MNTVGVRHGFEAGHRLPQLGGKCTNLHGHSWRVEVIFASTRPVGHTGVLVEFGQLKAGLRGWIDRELDHGLMLGAGDALTDVLAGQGKVFRFGIDPAVGESTDAEALAAGLYWPTVENVATLLSRVGYQLAGAIAADLYVARVHVTETSANFAEWLA